MNRRKFNSRNSRNNTTDLLCDNTLSLNLQSISQTWWHNLLQVDLGVTSWRDVTLDADARLD